MATTSRSSPPASRPASAPSSNNSAPANRRKPGRRKPGAPQTGTPTVSRDANRETQTGTPTVSGCPNRGANRDTHNFGRKPGQAQTGTPTNTRGVQTGGMSKLRRFENRLGWHPFGSPFETPISPICFSRALQRQACWSRRSRGRFWVSPSSVPLPFASPEPSSGKPVGLVDP